MAGRERSGDETLADVTRSSFPLLAPPAFEGDAARWSARRLGSGLIDAAERIAGRFPPLPPFGSGPLALGCFGPDRPRHALRQPPLYAGFTPHESQIMRALAHMLTGNAVRTRSFVAALFAANGLPVPPRLDLDALDRRAVIATEHRFQRRRRAKRNRDRRIDLLLRWTGRDGLARGVIVEAKFGHRVTPDQLPAMRSYALEAFHGLERAALFVIGTAPDHLTDRNPDWTAVQWGAVLRRWETALMVGDDDDGGDFARFRAALWARCR
jgi:hypothetical protein